MNQLLSNDIVSLRALEPTDLDLLYRWENDTALWVVSDTVAPYSRKALWQYLKEYTGDIYSQRQLRLMITLTGDGTAVGTVDFLNFDPLNNRAELGLFIINEMRGKGMGRQALDLITAYAREHLGIKQLYVYISTDNEACLHLFEHYGYRTVGVINSWVKRGRRYQDVALMQMIL
jgi:diamine N-acetyltransferase